MLAIFNRKFDRTPKNPHMKSSILLVILTLGFSSISMASPGDTTWIQANQVKLDYYNNFDDTVAFPDGSTSYRKILMIFTLGQYNCPAGSQYCHQWDYTVQNYIMTKGGDTLEMSRLITPYANSGWSRFGSSWKQPYVFDVTDYAALLKDSATVRIHYSGYSGGFTADIRFAFIEGTPDRNVTGFDKLYDFSHSYGDVNSPINAAFTTANLTAPANTKSATMRYIVTGHGSDDNGCCEFDNHFYKVNLNGNTIAQKDVWRDDCGMNELYPQGGTWIYNRANWCPGASVLPNNHELTGITENENYTVNIQFGPYAGSGAIGSYTSSATIFYYDQFNKTLDAAINDIIAPTNDPNYYRENPTGSKPQILVHNSGSTPISSIEFKYGIKDSTEHTYTWNGTIAPLEELTIELPILQELVNMSMANASGNFQFNAEIVKVNGQVDEDVTNNRFTSNFKAAPLWPSDLIISLKTGNLEEQNGNVFLGNPNQKWMITNMNGDIVALKDGTNADTQYIDTIGLPAAGIYKLTLTSDNNMGLHWWPYDNSNGVKLGAFSVKKLTGAKIPMKNYSYSGTSRDDWGSEYSIYFSVKEAGTYVGVKNAATGVKLNVYPNPAQDVLYVEVNEAFTQPSTIKLVNTLGQIVYSTTSQEQLTQINTSKLSNGVYTLLISNGAGTKTKKVIINK